jgi:hypothetical protein
MGGEKEHDMRDDMPARTSIANTKSRMAGGVDNLNLFTDENPPLVQPGPQDMPNGQDVKGS